MRRFDFLRSRLVDMIDWVEAPGLPACRNAIEGTMIKSGARLTVREARPV